MVSLLLWLGLQAGLESRAAKNCEAFLSTSLEKVLDRDDRDDEVQRAHELGLFIDENVHIRRVAIFTLGKFAPHQTQEDLAQLQDALRSHLTKLLHETLILAQPRSAEIVRSLKRGDHECIVESKLYVATQENVTLLWRVFKDGSDYWIQDVAIRDAGNTIWLSLELRAQFSVLLDKRDGSIDAVIQSIAEVRRD